MIKSMSDCGPKLSCIVVVATSASGVNRTWPALQVTSANDQSGHSGASKRSLARPTRWRRTIEVHRVRPRDRHGAYDPPAACASLDQDRLHRHRRFLGHSAKASNLDALA